MSEMIFIESLIAKPFADMAERIGKIDAAEFAGAVVIVPPSGDPVVFLTTDPHPVLPQFWSTVAARVEIAAAQAQDAESQQPSWPQRARR